MQDFLSECVGSESAKLRQLASHCLVARRKINYLKASYNRQLDQIRQNMKHDLENIQIELERLELETYHRTEYLDQSDFEGDRFETEEVL